jgi:hypothetical protein
LLRQFLDLLVLLENQPVQRLDGGQGDAVGINGSDAFFALTQTENGAEAPTCGSKARRYRLSSAGRAPDGASRFVPHAGSLI